MSPHYRKYNFATPGERQKIDRRFKQPVTLQSLSLLLQQALTAGKNHPARGESLAARGENLPEAAKITLKQEKEASEQAELILEQEKVVL
ncbi:hypothetical protein [Candidatus Electrothrix sp.]|uniref:hypothetical protein n=1 Tax=Candidatus Electrothrix sp. TaxID=2170559 RepID=UPI004056EA95